MFGHRHGALLRFLDRPQVTRDQVILPPEVLEGVERQVIGVARHAGQLLASGQHLKRGILLHGAPGTGKTHTVRYLLSQLTGTTVVVLSGGARHVRRPGPRLDSAPMGADVVIPARRTPPPGWPLRHG